MCAVITLPLNDQIVIIGSDFLASVNPSSQKQANNSNR